MISENLPDLAAFEFATALKSCGAACNDYHALWGYLRLTRIVSKGFETERDILEPLFREHAPEGVRVLIAGAADAGLFALVAGALFPRKAEILIADRCPAPLAVCRRFADTHGLPLTTSATDLTREDVLPGFGMAFLHNMLMLQPPDAHVPLLTHVRRALSPEGVLILVNRARVKPPSPPPPEEFASRLIAALRGMGVPLPEDEAAFRGRIERHVERQRVWSDAVIGRQHVEDCLDKAGFVIERRIDHERRRTVPERDGGGPVPMPTHIFIARARPGA